MQERLTEKMIERLRSNQAMHGKTKPDGGQRGLNIRFGARRCTWRFVARVSGKDFDQSIGTWPELSVQQARRKAAVLLDEAESGTLVTNRITLADAWAEVQPMIGNPDTAAVYAGHWRHELEPWGKSKKVVELVSGPAQPIHDLHADVLGRRGPFIANGVIAALRAIVKHTRSRYVDLPGWRCTNWPRAEENESEWDLSAANLRRHFALIEAEPYAPRRAFHLTVAYAGLRPKSLQSITWAHIEGDWLRQIHGKRGPIDVPITPQLRGLIEMCRGYDDEHVFAAPRGGPLHNYAIAGALCPRGMRKWHSTRAHLSVHPILAESLMTHALSGILGAMGGTYVRPPEADVADAARKVADAVDAFRADLQA